MHDSAQLSNHLSTCLSNVHHCSRCQSFELQPLAKFEEHGKKKNKKYKPAVITVNSVCPNCNFQYKLGGPIWNQSIHDHEFVKRVITHLKNNEDNYAESKRLLGI